MIGPFPHETVASQLRLLLEELCCDLVRFEHVTHDGLPPSSIRIHREYWLGAHGAYADIRVEPGGRPPYFVEVKYAYPDDILLRHLRRKYAGAGHDAAKIIIVTDCETRPNWDETAAALREIFGPARPIEIWDERRLLGLLRDAFHIDVQAITPESLLDVRLAVDRAKGYFAFGGPSLAAYEHDVLKAALLWHLDFWRLRELRETRRMGPREILPEDLYHNVVVLLGDLCSFSSYVRDTPDANIIRDSLTAFYSKARYQILNNGGLLTQFVGDQVIGLFGVPDRPEDLIARALDTARALVSIGHSVAQHWQRRIDRVQAAGGLHVGMAIGDVQLVSLRPFSRSHIGAIGDCINVAARLMDLAGPGEIAVTNSLHQKLDPASQSPFKEVPAVDLHNVGRIKAWKMALDETFKADL
jgi:class 3 adenylate cyclase